LGRGTSLGISYKVDYFSTYENGCFNLLWPKLSIVILKTPSFCALARAKTTFFQLTTLCEFTNPTMSTLDSKMEWWVWTQQCLPFLHDFKFNKWKKTQWKMTKNNEWNKHGIWFIYWLSKPWTPLWAPFFVLDYFNFLPKWCYVNAISNWFELVLDLHLKALGPIYGFWLIELNETLPNLTKEQNTRLKRGKGGTKKVI
jgi:hypothetical protein